MQYSSNIQLVIATIKDYQLIQNMARFVYDLSRECGHTSSDWQLPEDSLYESFDFKYYLTEQSKKAFLVKVNKEIAGFVLINQEKQGRSNIWNMGEFFIIARFQGKGIASIVAQKTWQLLPGVWQVSVIPENKKALIFWEKNIKKFNQDTFCKKIIDVIYDKHQPKRILFSFNSPNKK